VHGACLPVQSHEIYLGHGCPTDPKSLYSALPGHALHPGKGARFELAPGQELTMALENPDDLARLEVQD
jgi:hypothetical protein